MKQRTMMAFAVFFALSMFSAKCNAAALGPRYSGGAVHITKKRRRHGRTYRA